MSGEKKTDLVQVGVSQESREVLENLQAAGYIADLMDGFRLAIATAIGFGREPRENVDSDRKTTFAVGNLDPDSALREAIKEIYSTFRAIPARAAEDLAEQGLEIAKESFNGEEFSFSDIIDRVKKANA
ncbi:MAG: hypothetical protein WBL45_01215 [Solirubrobacterales bacterium]